jgi:hypothetical protein
MTEVTTEMKPWWTSRTIIGALVAVVASVVGGADAAMQAELVDIILNVVATVGAVMAIIGRYTATKKLKL